MRELKADETESVNGGYLSEDDLVLPVVTVTEREPAGGGHSSIGGIGRVGQGLQNYLAGLDSGYTIHHTQGGEAGYDPSPDDGIFGLKVEQNSDGSFDWEVEYRGYFDINGNGDQDPGEGEYQPGDSDTTTNGWGADYDEAVETLESYTVLPPESFV